MSITVDATGCACPEPVIRTKKAMKGDCREIIVLVDNNTACENIKRLAKKNGYAVAVEEKNDVFHLNLKKD